MKYARRGARWQTVINAGGRYLLHDEFTTDRAAGTLNGTPAEPGPGLRDVIDTGTYLSSAGGQLVRGVGVNTNDPVLRYGGPARAAGTALVWQLVTTSGICVVGFNNTLTTSATEYLYTTGTATFCRGPVGALAVGGALAAPAKKAIVTRSNGSFYFVDGRLLYLTTTPTVATLNVHVYGALNAPLLEYLRLAQTGWLPTPLASDGFSAWGTTDGLGHAEGVAGGLGSGGSGLSWTNREGTWTASGGLANAATLAGGVGIATVDTGKADVIVTNALTWSAGRVGLTLRYVNSGNYVRATYDGTNAALAKRVGGVTTTLINTAATYVAGAELRVTADGDKFRLYYNNVLIGTEQTIADAALQTPTLHGVYAENTANQVDNFYVYARGTGGEYSILDTI